MGAAFIYGFALRHTPVSMVVNQLPAFLPVFANGMLGAFVYTLYCTRCKHKRLLSPLFLAVAIGAAVCIQQLLVSCYSFRQDKQLWQLSYRIPLSFAFLAFLLASAFSPGWFRKIFSNRAMRFLGGISFNVYMWHQWIMVKLVRLTGFTNGGEVTLAGAKMQWLLTAEGLGLSLLAAVLTTYLIEKPMQKWIMNGGCKKP